MTLEFHELSELLKTPNFKFQKLDYLYLNDKIGYPLKAEMNFDNYFFIITVSLTTITVTGLLTGQEKELNISELKDNWWILRIPETIRMKIFP
jgi:hypothetical protein